MRTQDPTKADELARLMDALIASGDNGLTVDEVSASMGWSEHKSIERILDVGGRVSSVKSRGPHREKITKFFLKVSTCI